MCLRGPAVPLHWSVAVTVSVWLLLTGAKVPVASSGVEQRPADASVCRGPWVLVCEALALGTANGLLLACLKMKRVPSEGRSTSAGSQLQRKRRALLTWEADARLSA